MKCAHHDDDDGGTTTTTTTTMSTRLTLFSPGCILQLSFVWSSSWACSSSWSCCSKCCHRCRCQRDCQAVVLSSPASCLLPACAPAAAPPVICIKNIIHCNRKDLHKNILHRDGLWYAGWDWGGGKGNKADNEIVVTQFGNVGQKREGKNTEYIAEYEA